LSVLAALALGAGACTTPAASAVPSAAASDAMMEHSAAPSDAMMEHSAAPSDAMMEHSATPS
jgi:hypothetical protein